MVYISIVIVVLLLIAVKWYDSQKKKNKVICVIESNCTGCQRCAKRCTRRVLEMVKNETGAIATVKYPDKYTACGDCLSKCKFSALKLIERVWQ
jgi:ferredoxin